MGVTLCHAPFGRIGEQIDWFETVDEAYKRAREIANGKDHTTYVTPEGIYFLLVTSAISVPPKLGDDPLLAAVFAVVPDEPLRRHEVPPDYPPPPTFTPED